MLSMRANFFVIALVTALVLPIAAAEAAPELTNPGMKRLSAHSESGLRFSRQSTNENLARVSGFRWKTNIETPEDAARGFIKAFPELVPMTVTELRLSEVEQTSTRRVVRFKRFYKGMRVLDQAVTVSVTQGDEVIGLTSSAAALENLDENLPDIGWQKALGAAHKAVYKTPAGDEKIEGLKLSAHTSKVVIAQPGQAVIAYRIQVPTIPGLEKITCLINAATGEVIQVRNEAMQARRQR
jgi:Zn-dependent metalloprotease